MTADEYSMIWDKLILPYFKKCQNRYNGLLCPASGKREFISHYEDLNALARKHYMAKDVKRLNRHKVAAATMIAILKTKPIKKVISTFYDELPGDDPPIWPFNESLAISVGLSVLRAFILQRVDEDESFCAEDSTIFANGIPLEQKDREEWEWELYQIRQEGSYNLLAMAHILKDLEIIARLEYFQAKVKAEDEKESEEEERRESIESDHQ